MKFKRSHLKPKPNQQWKTPEGYQLFVMDGGAVHICYPTGWITRATEYGSLKLHDAEPPTDSCKMQLSYFRHPPNLPRTFNFARSVKLLEKAKVEEKHDDIQPPVISRRDGLQFGWVASKYPDSEAGRMVHSRALVVIGNCVQALITYDCWEDEVEKFAPVWDTLLKTIRLGEFIANPATGQLQKPDLN